MKRTLAIASLLLVLGCQAEQRFETPAGLANRLALVERSRLSATSGDVASTGFRSTAPDVVRTVRTNQPPTWAAQYVVESDHASSFGSQSLTLSELGDGSRLDPQSGGEDAATGSESKSASRNDTADRDPPLASFWETVKRDVKHAPHDLWRDTKRVYANPVNLVILGVAYGGSLAIQETGPDETVEHYYNRQHDFEAPHHTFSEDWRDAFGAVGNPVTHFALAGAWYLLGQQTMNDKTYEVGKTMFSGLMINSMTVMVGQAASWDKAPNGEYGTFPSGHTSSSFVVASVLHEAYGHVVGVPLYGLATLVGIERLDDREHYFSDVVMGAVLGTVIGHSVASGRDPEFFGWKILPYASPEGGSGVAFMKTLD